MSRGPSAQQRQFLDALRNATSEIRPDYYQLATELAGIPSRRELLKAEQPPSGWGLPTAPTGFAEWELWWKATLRKHAAASTSLRRSVQLLANKGYLERGWHKNTGLLLVRKTMSEDDRREYETLEKQALYYQSLNASEATATELHAARLFAAKYRLTTGVPPSDANPDMYLDRPKR